MISPTIRNCLVVVAVVAAGAAMYWLRGILAPLALAIFLLVMIDGLARAICRYLKFVPTQASFAVAIVLILVAFGLSIWVMVDGFAGFKDQLSGIGARVDQIIRDVAGLLNLSVAPTLNDLIARADPQRFIGPAAMVVQNVLGDAFFVLVYLGFLIASRHGFRKKIVALFPSREERREASHIFERVRGGIEAYVWVQTVTGAMIAVGCFAIMVALKLDNAPFWAFVIFLLSYIPIIGAMIAGLGPPLFALVQFQSYWPALILFAGIQVILFVVGNIIQPRMQAQSSNIDAVVVLLSLAFWGALWGVTGAFLSTPLTVVCMAILAEFRGSRWVAVLLSEDGHPYPMEDEDHDPPSGENPEAKAEKAVKKAIDKGAKPA
jgi:predicted PurR-regulated permease PerM